MAGRPLTKINQTMSALLDATQGGREAEAKQLFARLTNLSVEAGIPRPAMPEEIMALAQSWQMSVHNSPDLASVPGTDLDMSTRHLLIDAGMKAARRMQALVEDDSAFGASGWLDQRQQVQLLNTAMARAYGMMPSGARFLKLPDGSTGDKQRTSEGDERMSSETVSLMIRRRVHKQGEAEEELVGGDIIEHVSGVLSSRAAGPSMPTSDATASSPTRRRRRVRPC